MRVLHVIASLTPRDGGPSNLPKLAVALARQGCDVSVFTTDIDEQGSMWPWHRTRRLSAEERNTDPRIAIRFFPVGWPSRYKCSWSLLQALQQTIRRVDLVHIHSLYLFPSTVAAHYCRLHGVPYILRPHGTLDPWHRRQRWWLKLAYHCIFEDRNIRKAAAMHYTSASEAEFARALGITTPGFTIRQGIDLDEFKRLPSRGRFRAKHPELAAKRLIVFLGRITPKKGFDVLIPAFRDVAASVPDLHLVVAGPDNEGYGKTVRRWVHDFALDRHVTWTGLVTGSDKIELLRDADVWVLPSHDENFGVAAVEAMAAGAAIVITNQVGVCQAVEEARAGIVVDAGVGIFAHALKQILSNDSLRMTLGHRARSAALKHFTWDGVAGDVLQMYREIIATQCPAVGDPVLQTRTN